MNWSPLFGSRKGTFLFKLMRDEFALLYRGIRDKFGLKLRQVRCSADVYIRKPPFVSVASPSILLIAANHLNVLAIKQKSFSRLIIAAVRLDYSIAKCQYVVRPTVDSSFI
jgi:hypothetical protein